MTVILRRIVFAAILVIVVAGAVVSPSRGAETQAPEEWIFSVIMPPQWSIVENMFVYQFKGGYYLPVVELAEAYEFFVEAETDRAFVSGFAGREENTFTIDGERGELIVKGESEALPVDSIIPKELVIEEDIYVRLDVLNKIWPVEMRIELSSLRITAEAEEELSFVRRKKREDQQEIIKARKSAFAGSQKDLPYRDNPYRWLGKPILDLQSSYVYDNRNKILTGSNNISGTQQLGQFVTNYAANYAYLDGQLRRPGSIRANFLRQAVGDEDLFVPTLKHFEFGDISVGQRDLIGNNAGGRGFSFSNKASSKTREFDRITVEGTGPPGWQLELYNNNEILEFSAIEDDGEYRFENVILNFGNNRIRVIMYGPQGQVREVVEEYKISNSLLSPGEFQYRGGIVDTGRSFILLDNELDPKLTVTQNAEIFYGLNRWLSLFGSYTKTPLATEEKQYYTAGLAFNTPIGVGEAEGYKEINGGKAVDLRFITRLMGVSLNMRSAFFHNFESQEAGSKRFEAEVQANTSLNLPFLPMTLRINAKHTQLIDGNVSTDLNTAQSFTGGGIRFNHSTNTRFVNEIHETSSGGFGVNWNRGDWQTRGSLNYKIHPVSELNAGSAEIRYKTKENLQAALNTNHSFSDSTSTVGAQLGYDFQDILSTVDAQYRQERGWLFTLRASTSLNPYNSDRSYKLSSKSKKSQAPVLGHIFLDRDGDGAFSEGDEPLEGVKLSLDRGRSQTATNEDGYIVTSLRNNEKMEISIDEASLEDPYFRPSVEGYSTVGLKGTMPGFEFPVVETGAVDGTVWREPSGRPVSGMKLELVSESGEVYMRTETAFDGYYAFEFVLPGTYTVRADPSYQVYVPAETVTVSSEELFAFGIDLYLLEPVAEEKAAEQASGESGGVAHTYHAPAVSGTEQPALVSPLDGGSSAIDEETSDEESSPVVESSVDGDSLPVDQSDSSGGAPSIGLSIVKDVRIGEHPDEVRLVLDLSGPASYDINEGNGLIILVDLPGSIWGTVSAYEFKYSKVLKGYVTETLPDKGTRLILKAHEGMFVKEHKLLPAVDGKPDRLIIDLKKK